MFIKEKKPKIYAIIGTNTWQNSISLIISNIVTKGIMVLESVIKYSEYREMAKNRQCIN